MSAADVIWHDIECGGYGADLDLWFDLAAGCAGPVLDVGAGTGRVSLALAARGHAVVALDIEDALLAALRERAGDLPVRTVVGDARAFALPGCQFELIIAPMQTVQLLGPVGRRNFLRTARAHLVPGGRLAVALLDGYEPFEADDGVLPHPDRAIVDGVMYCSQPIAVRDEGARVAIERTREVRRRGGEPRFSDDVIYLDHVEREVVEAEARAIGLEPLPPWVIPPTEDHSGTVVVMLRA